MKKKIKKDIGPVEYSSVYWYIEHEIKKGEEIFTNYGNHHNSAEMLALFGFVDSDTTEEDDFYTFHVELLEDDKNYAFKEKHFEKYWPDQDVMTKHPGINYGRTIYLASQEGGSINKKMANNMRLNYLPNSYFDSFTISSILNGFERRYLKKVIDPLIEDGFHRGCDQLLEGYGTDNDEDEQELVKIAIEHNQIRERMKNKDRDVE